MAVYQDIAEEIARDIRTGYYRPGDRILSTSELRGRYGVSLMTAVRVHQALAEMGAARKVRGNGVFANAATDFAGAVAATENTELRKIKVFCDKAAFEAFHGETRTGVMNGAASLGLSVEYAFINRREVSETALSAVSPEPHTGYIVLSTGPELHLAIGALLLSGRVRCAVIDTIVSGSHAVLTDNFDGIERIVDHLLERGYRRIVFADKFKSSIGMINASERRLAFDLRARRGDFESRVIDSGRFQDLTEFFARSGPQTAFAFPQDAPALRFRALLLEDGAKKLPGIAGFDNYGSMEGSVDALTTVQINHREIGEKAVAVLLKPMKVPEIVRVKGQLIVRETTGETVL